MLQYAFLLGQQVCTDKRGIGQYARSGNVSHASIYHCGLAGLKDLRIRCVQPKCFLRSFATGYICTIYYKRNCIGTDKISLRQKITR